MCFVIISALLRQCIQPDPLRHFIYDMQQLLKPDKPFKILWRNSMHLLKNTPDITFRISGFLCQLPDTNASIGIINSLPEIIFQLLYAIRQFFSPQFYIFRRKYIDALRNIFTPGKFLGQVISKQIAIYLQVFIDQIPDGKFFRQNTAPRLKTNPKI